MLQLPALSGAACAKGTYVNHALILKWLLFYLSLKKDSDDEDSEGEDASVTQGDLEALISGHYPVKSAQENSDSSSAVAQPASKWVCAQSSNSKKENHNQCITEKLEVLAKAYSVQGDKWRALGYSKAINVLKSYHKPVTSYQVKHLPRVAVQGGKPSILALLRARSLPLPVHGVAYLQASVIPSCLVTSVEIVKQVQAGIH